MIATTERRSLRRIASEQLQGLYAFARHLVGDQADDLVQETLLRACRSFHTLGDEQAAPKCSWRPNSSAPAAVSSAWT